MTARQIDENGFLTIQNNPISREGVFQYLGSSIGAPEPERIYNVYRPASELEDPECLSSFANIPLIDDHTMLGPSDEGMVPPEQVGVHGTTLGNVKFEGGVLSSDLKIYSEKLKAVIDAGKKGLSLGYRCLYQQADGIWKGQAYEYVQRKLRGNHIALVHTPRCDVAVLDGLAMDEFDLNQQEISEMDKKDENKQPVAMDAATIEAKFTALDGKMTGIEGMLKQLLAKDADEEPADKKAEMTDEEKAEAEKKAADKKAADAEAEKEKAEKAEDKSKAQDAAIASLTTAFDSFKKDGVKAVMSEITSRNALAEKLSFHIGTFDHSLMTTAEVAAYGVEKLGLKPAKGSEVAALDGYLYNRPSPVMPGIAADAGEAGKGGSVDKYISESKE